MNRIAWILSGLLVFGGGCVVVDDRHPHGGPPGQSGGGNSGEVSKHPHGGPPGQAKKDDHPHGGPPGQTKKRVVTVEATHVCVVACLHFYFEGVWYLEDGHKHGDDCGHELSDGKWGQAKGHDKDKKDKKEKKDKKDK